jgi:isopentenyl diphosphate isomerase/L-lactate dehydrogenase-like FMN-dependent dehydrogenase
MGLPMPGIGYGRRRQADIYLAGVRGQKPLVPQSAAALEQEAERTMSKQGFAYMAGGAGLETTVKANRAAFERVRIVPRMLRGPATRDLGIELFGRTLPAPLLLAPIGVLEMAHRDGDVAVARAAAAEGVPMIFSSQASRPLEECATAMRDAPRWFQLYMSTSNELVRSFVSRAERAGCEAIVITLDTTMLGWRLRDLDLGYLPFLAGKGIAQYVTDPVFQRLVDDAPPPERGSLTPGGVGALWRLARAYPGSTWANLRSPRPRQAVRTFLDVFARPSLNWQDLAIVRDATALPILLKGILHPDDARRAC